MNLPRFGNLSLSRKLTFLFSLVSAVALVIFARAIWTYQSAVWRAAMLRQVSVLAQFLADSNAAALAFRDNRSARDSLEGMRSAPLAVRGCLYLPDDRLVASYERDSSGESCPPHPGPERAFFSGEALTIVRTARLRGEPEGKLLVSADLTDLNRQQQRLALICAAVILASLLLTAIVSSRLQRIISGPILDLAEVAGLVSSRRDYSVRARRRSKDELGVLVGRFNEMMHQIQQRDLALEQAQAELEERVRGRTRELQDEIVTRRLVEQDLLNAKEAAEASNRAKSAFLATMSHELRTPLNAIIGYSDILEEDATADGNGSAISDLRCIRTAGQHLLQLINDVLDLSKIEAGRMEIHAEPAIARTLAADVSMTAQPLAARNHNEFVLDLPDDDYLVNVDAVRFRQSLLNLLSNACKFTERGKISLIVGRETEPDGNWILFEVRDTGPGIAPEDRKKLFKAFSQIDSSATRKHGGTGLGLSISQRFCQMMGGEITVASEPGQGSAFTIRLPESLRA